MSQNIGRAKRSEKGLLTPDNCVVTLINLQPQMLFGVSNFDRQAIINSNVALAKAARVFDVPVVLSTVETKSFSGNLWPQIKAVIPKQVPIERSSMNSWDDKNFVAAIEKSGRKKIVLAGLWTETCVSTRNCIHAACRSSSWPVRTPLRSDEERIGKWKDRLPGQLGVHILRPAPGSGSREYGILRRFENAEARDEFYRLPLFEEWKQKVVGLVEGEPRYERLSGLETWFTLPGQRAIVPPLRWKMAVMTLLGVYPASLLLGVTVGNWISGWPRLVSTLIIGAFMVILLTWALMPQLTRLLKAWLYPNSGNSVSGL